MFTELEVGVIYEVFTASKNFNNKKIAHTKRKSNDGIRGNNNHNDFKGTSNHNIIIFNNNNTLNEMIANYCAINTKRMLVVTYID